MAIDGTTVTKIYQAVIAELPFEQAGVPDTKENRAYYQEMVADSKTWPKDQIMEIPFDIPENPLDLGTITMPKDFQ